MAAIRNMIQKIYPIILSGGAGTRLWPVSRESHPKPFLRLADGQSLLQKTFLRVTKVPGVNEIMTITNHDLYFETDDSYRQVNATHFPLSYILEPFGRNTAAAVASSALRIVAAYGEDAILLILPADHMIENEMAFNVAVERATSLAQQGYMVTFGITPDRPETAYGYIEADTSHPLATIEPCAYPVSRFVEKPEVARAEKFLSSGRHFWNSGMFCMRAGTVTDEFRRHAPHLLDAVKRCLDASVRTSNDSNRRLKLDADTFCAIPEQSIDYALMEKSTNVAVVTCDIGWSDIGSWDALGDLTRPDALGNRVSGEVLLHGTKDCYVRSAGRLIAAVGVSNLILVDTPDALLVTHREHAQDVKNVVRHLKQIDHEAAKIHQTVYRPWGAYTVIEQGEGFKIKRINIKPGASLSLQMHHHRSEHWVVVCGTAKVINGEKSLFLNVNESTFIPAGHKHRLENPGMIELVIIEVQSGDYLGEDDIIRFDDNYGRA